MIAFDFRDSGMAERMAGQRVDEVNWNRFTTGMQTQNCLRVQSCMGEFGCNLTGLYGLLEVGSKY